MDTKTTTKKTARHRDPTFQESPPAESVAPQSETRTKAVLTKKRRETKCPVCQREHTISVRHFSYVSFQQMFCSLSCSSRKLTIDATEKAFRFPEGPREQRCDGQERRHPPRPDVIPRHAVKSARRKEHREQQYGYTTVCRFGLAAKGTSEGTEFYGVWMGRFSLSNLRCLQNKHSLAQLAGGPATYCSANAWMKTRHAARLRLHTQAFDTAARAAHEYTQRCCGAVAIPYRLSPSNVRVSEDTTSNDWAMRSVHWIRAT